MASKNSLRELREEDLDNVAAGHISRIAVVIRSSDQTITQTSGSQLDVITNNNWIIQGKQIGQH
jgi:hypothetical protein